MLLLNPPKFSGGRMDNIHEWAEMFEQLIFSFPDEQKCLLLDKAFVQPAQSWFKDYLMPRLLMPWRDAKKIILEEFSKESSEDRSYERLKTLTYNPHEYGSLTLFINDYSHTYSKAFPKADRAEIVRATIRNLPQAMRHKLNQFKDLKEISSVEALKAVTKRYDQEPEAI